MNPEYEKFYKVTGCPDPSLHERVKQVEAKEADMERYKYIQEALAWIVIFGSIFLVVVGK